MNKDEALLHIARKRLSFRMDGYLSIGDFYDGIFECDHVSPWTKSGSNVNAEVMIVGQDWSSSEALMATNDVDFIAEFGFSPKFSTNANLHNLLKRYFGLDRTDCYITNLFPYIKQGKASASIPLRYLADCAKRFTQHEIEIVLPKLVLCLGLATFIAMMRSSGLKGSPKVPEAIQSPFLLLIQSCIALRIPVRLG